MIEIDKGDIVTVKESAYIDFPGGLWRDHFVETERHYISLEITIVRRKFQGDIMSFLSFVGSG